ncbi:MAG: DUF364 domain-containing protein [Candidatus Bathyarchaeia archaeon]
MDYLEEARNRLLKLLSGKIDMDLPVTVSPLPINEAIGEPHIEDLPLLKGKERLLEAKIKDAKGQAFTDSPKSFKGSLKEAFSLDIAKCENRAIFVATLNAVLRYLGFISKSIHCKDNAPLRCAFEILNLVKPFRKIGIIGFHPAIAQVLASNVGVDNIMITDLDKENIGKVKFGVEILDGERYTDKLISEAQIVLLTGTTFINGTFSYIFEKISMTQKPYYVYGITASGICRLLSLNHVCPYGY